jgi:NAD-dependent SIR2 family protein deacetylase
MLLLTHGVCVREGRAHWQRAWPDRLNSSPKSSEQPPCCEKLKPSYSRAERGWAWTRACPTFVERKASAGAERVSTSRSAGAGFWKAYPPMKELGLDFQSMANPSLFETDPELAWGFYGHRLQLYRDTTPHRGFRILKELTLDRGIPAFVFTTNVDGQFQKSGWPENRLVENHGSIHHLQCMYPMACGRPEARHIVDATPSCASPQVDPVTFRAESSSLPRCHCEQREYIARPNILMFGDNMWVPSRSGKQRAQFVRFLDALGCDRPTLTSAARVRHASEADIPRVVVVDIGSGIEVPTCRIVSESVACGFGSKGSLIRINTTRDEIPSHSQLQAPEADLIRAVPLRLGALDALAWISEHV